MSSTSNTLDWQISVHYLLLGSAIKSKILKDLALTPIYCSFELNGEGFFSTDKLLTSRGFQFVRFCN